ncbi:MAG: NADPH-dependent oxidoreductase [Phycisphaerales bacterium]|nr:NADPH-dependent oxidoreductase [Phycisphaerales bacterium]
MGEDAHATQDMDVTSMPRKESEMTESAVYPQTRSTIDVMHGHTSCRRFVNEPVNRDVVETLIEAGTRASTSSNMQAYTVISITDAELKRRMAYLCADQPQIHKAPVFLAFCVDLHRLQLCCGMHDVEGVDFGLAEAFVMAVVDTALVMENVAVAAESLGLGVCMIGEMRGHPFEVREALKLPPLVFAVSGLCIGWPAEKNEPKPRLPLEAVWHENTYRADDELIPMIEAHDGIMSAFYDSQGMHPSDPRWSSVAAKRAAGMARRKDVGAALRRQGLNTQGE